MGEPWLNWSNSISKWLTVFIVLTISGCVHPPQNSYIAGWKTNTIRLIHLSTDESGGFSEPPTGIAREPDLYATYYNLKLKTILAQETSSDYTENTVSWVKSRINKGHFEDDKTSLDTIGEIYYGLNILAEFGQKPPFSEQFAQTIHELQLPQGVYASGTQQRAHLVKANADISPDDVLLSTYEALVALKLLGQTPAHQEQLVKWLQTMWDKAVAQGADEVFFLASLNRLRACLQIVAPDDPRIQQTWMFMQPALKTMLSENNPNPEAVLINLAAAVETAERLPIKPDSWKPEKYLQKLSQKQNFDGGYNAFGQNDSDLLGTFSAAQIFHYFHADLFHKAAMLQLVDLHRSTTGGYFNIYAHPPNILATWGVLQYADMFGLSVDRTKLAAYLQSIWQSSDNPGEIHYALAAAQLASIARPEDVNLVKKLQQLAFENSKSFQQPDHLLTLYHISAALRLLGHSLPEPVFAQLDSSRTHLQTESGAYGFASQPSLQVTALLVLLYNMNAKSLPNQPKITAWLQAQQKAEGFIETGQAPDLFTTYLAVLALDALHTTPKDATALSSLALDYLRPDGGAGYTPNAQAQPYDGNFYVTGIVLQILKLTGNRLD